MVTRKVATLTKPQARTGRSSGRQTGKPTFPIVGIGASAGGLEALEVFLRHVPKGSGMAFVVVQHLDPTHKGMMAELLQRATSMTVVQAKDRTRVRPDSVYVIPPNKDMSILHRVLHLLDPVAPRGLRHPIDFFFRALADDLADLGIGVVLSGMGSDGTLGIKAIKENAGAAFVQEPASAKFDAMPRSVIEAGLADVVAPVEALPGKIAAYLAHVPMLSGRPGLAEEDKAQSALNKITILLRAQTGHDFSLYKKSTVYRRIERRMGIHQIRKITDYVRFLRENPPEADLLFSELLIGVTSFFRDPPAWEQLQTEVIPALANRLPSPKSLRVWVPGCSTGEEAYSLAIAFLEALAHSDPEGRCTVQIFATDLDQRAIAKARTGLFPVSIAADVSAERLSRFFVRLENNYQVAKPVRDMVIFAPQNLIMDPPFTRLDLVSCRNLLIYLTPELQKKLLPLFHYCLNPDGFLFLGSAESSGESGQLFAPLHGGLRLYRRIESGPGVAQQPVEFPSVTTRRDAPPPAPLPAQVNLQALAQQLLLQRYSPPAVLVNDKGDILYVSGRTGKYLEPAAGKVNWNVFAMAREGLHHELSSAFRKALHRDAAVTVRNVRVGTDGGVQAVDLSVQAIAEPKALRGSVMIVFADVATALETPAPATARGSRGGGRTAALARDLEQARLEVQTLREQMQAFQEEAKSAHEELQSTNEELQSTNEELTTSQEEMQAMNEELETLNYELKLKVEDLSRRDNDMKNLLESTEMALVFLDGELRVRLFTGGSNQVFKLTAGDAGRLITDFASELAYPELARDAREVLRTLIPHQQTVAGGEGRWFMVRLMPYRTLDNRIDGVVITFADITDSTEREAGLRKTQAELEDHIGTQDRKLSSAQDRWQTEIQRQEHARDAAGTVAAGDAKGSKS